MFLIQQITSDARQKQNLVITSGDASNGTIVTLEMYFASQQYGWFITSLVYQNFTLEGFRIINSPNMLQQFKNQIPFGLACFSSQDREPTQQQDFSSGASSLYLLSEDEVAEYTEFLSGQV